MKGVAVNYAAAMPKVLWLYLENQNEIIFVVLCVRECFFLN